MSKVSWVTCYDLSHILDIQLNQGASMIATEETRKSPLYYAIQGGHIKCAETLLRHGAPIAGRDFSDQICALDVAIFQCKDLLMAKLIMQHGADINGFDTQGYSALHNACFRGDEKSVEVLLNLGADANRAALDGHFPISLAVRGGRAWVTGPRTDSIQIVKVLLSHGSNVNIFNPRGDSLLHTVTVLCGGVPRYLTILRSRLAETMEMLLAYGAEVNALDSEGKTALWKASQKYHLQGAKILLERGADVNIPCNAGTRVLSEVKKVQIKSDIAEGLHYTYGQEAEWVKDDRALMQLLIDHGATE